MLSLKVKSSLKDPNLLDQFSVALVSTNPPLSTESIEKIADITRFRLEQLFGSEQENVKDLFELLSTLPPLQGQRAKRLLLAVCNENLEETHIMCSLERAFESLRYASKEEGDDNLACDDDIGFVEADVVISSDKEVEYIPLPKRAVISFDSEYSLTEGIEILSAMIVKLSRINQSERQNVVNDCCKIMDLRLEFEFK